MTTRILPAAGDADAARALSALLGQLPDAEPAAPLPDSGALLDTLARLAAGSVDELPEVVLVHERIGPVPALDLIREVALRFPAVGVVLLSSDTGPALFSAAMDSGARGLIGLPPSYEELAARVQAAAQWSAGVRRHLGRPADAPGGPGGRVVTVAGAKGGVGTTLTAVQFALAAAAAGRRTVLVDMDLQAGDVGSYLDVQFRRSIADLAGIHDISPRVLQDAVYDDRTGLALLLAPAEGERGEELDDRAARHVVTALRGRYELVVVDCGTQVTGANAAVVEMADTAALVTTPDVISVRAAKRMVRMWERLQVRKAEDTVMVVNRWSKHTEIQPALIGKITKARVVKTPVPAAFKELQPVVDAGRLQDLDNRSAVKQALWTVAGELGLLAAPADPAGAAGAQAALPGRDTAGGGRSSGAALAVRAAGPVARLRRGGGDRGSLGPRPRRGREG
ncbi:MULTISPECIES: CpaE family protein [Streptomyces]|uniref:AAA family ATPase n=1 Tax=Streptomyces TaxID=1883 RepID=UPI00167AE989|nr:MULTISPECIES: AAA family ATPase [Streptomyces]MBD3576490.1 AAA family ATPase [Streptomyces sp. KD18]GGS88739.1 septum formation initiator [Streptomyces toxytricini]